MKRTNITTITLLFLLLVVAGTAKGQQWTEIHTGLNEEYLWDICCIDENQVLVCGNNGLIAKSTDGGLHWERKDTPLNKKLILLRFANDQVGFALGINVLLKTIDGGETWSNLESANSIDLGFGSFDSDPNLFLVDADTLYLSDCQTVIWKSIDGGETFSQMIDFEEYYWGGWKIDLYFNDNMGYVVGHVDPYNYENDFPIGFKTMDFGQTWEPIVFGFPFLECIHSIHFTDKFNGRIFGCFNDDPYWYEAIETTDGFESYSLLIPDDYGCWNFGDIDYYPRAMVFTSENDGCMFFNVDCIKPHYHNCGAMFTSDNGNNWTTMSNGINTQRYLLSIDGIGSTYYIAADDYVLYKINLSETAVDETETFVKVFPNPTSDKVFVNIEPAVEPETSSPVHVELTGADGRIVMQRTLLGNNVTLDMDNLSPGIYVLSVKGNSFLHRQTIIKTE